VATVGGIDTGFQNGSARTVIVTFDFPKLDCKECVVSEGRVNFPYTPGLLSFREKKSATPWCKLPQ
jgi:deoxyribonuclease V